MSIVSVRQAISKRWLLRATGSAVVLGALIWFLPVHAIWRGLERIPFDLFVWVFLMFVVGHLVAAAKWWNLLSRKVPFLLAVRAHIAGLGANLCLPGAAGGDAVRAGLAYAEFRDGPKIAAGSTADRLIDMLALACLGTIGYLKLEDAALSDVSVLPVFAAILALCIGFFYAFPAVILVLWARISVVPVHDIVVKTAMAMAILGRKPVTLLCTLFLSVAVQLLFIALAYQLALAVGVCVSFSAWCFAWSLAKIIAVLPISLGGLGIREATLAALLVPLGADAAQVVAAGLAWQAVLFLTGGMGGLILTLSGSGVWRKNTN